MVKSKVTLVKFVGSVDPYDIMENPLPIKGASRDDLMFQMDNGKLYIFMVVTGTIEEAEEKKEEGE